jgi:O-antigen ligase
MKLGLANKRETYLVYLVSFLFVALNTFLIAKEFYYFSIIPLVLLIVLIAVYALDKLVLIAVFVTPLSVQLSDIIKGYDFDLSLPSEPLLIGILLFFLLKYLFEGQFDRKILYHPVSIVILFNLVWIFITSITSTMPLVSFKFLTARIWFLLAFYLLATQIFRKIENIKVYTWMYIIPFLIVIGYAWVRHAGYGFFNQQAAHFVVQPFYNDHTSYGAILAMLIPVLIGFISIQGKVSMIKKVSLWIVTFIFFAAVLFSYTRAAWVSLVGALGVYIIIRFRIKFSYLAILGMVFLAFLYGNRSDIKIKLEQNRQTSSEDLMEQFKQKPVFGWGPGVYMFQYAPFQLEREKTEISTNAANLGNAHSEYIGPLAESGIPGTISFLAIVIYTIITGVRNWTRVQNRKVRILSLSLLLGLITYYLHGLLNNFLDTDKASAVFWAFTAAIVAIDVYHRETRFRNSE